MPFLILNKVMLIRQNMIFPIINRIGFALLITLIGSAGLNAANFQNISLTCNVDTLQQGTLASFLGFNKRKSELLIQIYLSENGKNFVTVMQKNKASIEFSNTRDCMHHGLWYCTSSVFYNANVVSANLYGNDSGKKISSLSEAYYEMEVDLLNRKVFYKSVEYPRYIPFVRIEEVSKGDCG